MASVRRRWDAVGAADSEKEFSRDPDDPGAIEAGGVGTGLGPVQEEDEAVPGRQAGFDVLAQFLREGLAFSVGHKRLSLEALEEADLDLITGLGQFACVGLGGGSSYFSDP
jgi:hypothetical protein